MGEERVIISQDWITITFAIGILLIATAKIFSRISITDVLSAYGSDRFVNVTRSNSDGFVVLKLASLIVYALCIALLIYAVVITKHTKPATLNTYLLCLLGVSVFSLLKHYLGKLLANILGFEHVMAILDFHRNVYRCMFSYALLAITILLFVVFKLDPTAVSNTTGTAIFIVVTYNIILFYTYRQLWIGKLFYFILYLCTLEIAPYLLFYKYFKEISG
jgi:hypothetical protein